MLKNKLIVIIGIWLALASPAHALQSIVGGVGDLTISTKATDGGGLLLNTRRTGTGIYIDTSNNVGIGTAAPGDKLHVAHTSGGVALRLSSTTDVDGSNINAQFMSGNRLLGQIKGERINTSTGILSLGSRSVDAINYALHIRDGNVGIGITNPNSKLDISGSSSAGVNIDIDNTNTSGFSGFRFFENGTQNFGFVVVNSSGTGYEGGPGAVQIWNYKNGPMIFANNSTERMRLTAAGNLGIGTNSPNVTLDVIGDIEYTGTITDVSDIRTKENISKIKYPLDKLGKITGIYYDSKLDGKRSLGVIAQEVKKVIPEAVSITNTQTRYLGVDYTQLVPLLIESVKEQQEIIHTLKAENKSLKLRLEKVEKMLNINQ